VLFQSQVRVYEGFPELISKQKGLQQREIENTYVPILDEQQSIITEPYHWHPRINIPVLTVDNVSCGK
jgi:hypothetical protein